MKKALHDFCKDFISAEKIISKAEPLQMPYVYPICAQMFAERGLKPDVKLMKQCDKLFAEKAGMFFDFTGTSVLMLVSHLSMTENPKKAIEAIGEAKAILKQRFDSSEALPLAALILTQGTEKDNWPAIADEAKSIFDAIVGSHHLLTSGGDMIFSILLAKSGKHAEITEDAGSCYQLLKELLPGTDPRTLSRVLALENGGTPEEKCVRFMEVYNKLKEKGYVYGKRYQLPMLGLTAMLPMDTDEIVDDICEVDKYLSRQDLYRGLLMWYSKTVRLMHAAMIVAGAFALERRRSGEDVDDGVNTLLTLDVSLWSLFYVLFI